MRTALNWSITQFFNEKMHTFLSPPTAKICLSVLIRKPPPPPPPQTQLTRVYSLFPQRQNSRTRSWRRISWPRSTLRHSQQYRRLCRHRSHPRYRRLAPAPSKENNSSSSRGCSWTTVVATPPTATFRSCSSNCRISRNRCVIRLLPRRYGIKLWI